MWPLKMLNACVLIAPQTHTTFDIVIEITSYWYIYNTQYRVSCRIFFWGGGGHDNMSYIKP